MSSSLLTTVRIPDLPPAGALRSTDLFPVEQLAGTRKTTLGDILFDPLRTAATSITNIDEVQIKEASTGEIKRATFSTIYRYLTAKGVGLLFGTLALAAAADLTGVNQIAVTGNLVSGDGGAAPYVYTASEPTHSAKFQSADGRWFQLATSHVSPKHFGARGDNVTNDAVALQAWFDYLARYGQEGYLTYGLYRTASQLTLNGHVTIRGESIGAQYVPQNDPVGLGNVGGDRLSGSWIILADGAAAANGWNSPTTQAIIKIIYNNPNAGSGYKDFRRFCFFENFGVHGNSGMNKDNEHAGILVSGAWCVKLDKMQVRDVTGYNISTDQASAPNVNDLWLTHSWISGGFRTRRVVYLESGDSHVYGNHIWGDTRNPALVPPDDPNPYINETVVYSFVGTVFVANRVWGGMDGCFFSQSANNGLVTGNYIYGPMGGRGIFFGGSPWAAGIDPVFTVNTNSAGTITSITIDNAGTGIPDGTRTFAFDDGTGVGTGGAANATISGGMVVLTTVTAGGTGYGLMSDGTPTGYGTSASIDPGSGSKFTVTGNVLYGVGNDTTRTNAERAAIFISGNPRSLTISGNTFSGGGGSFDYTTTYAIYCSGSRGSMRRGLNAITGMTVNEEFIPSTVDLGEDVSQFLIGSRTPRTLSGSRTPALQVQGTGGSSSSAGFFDYSDTAVGFFLGMLKHRGTPAAPTAVQAGDRMGTYSFEGYDGTTPRSAARFSAIVAAVTPGSIVAGDALVETVDATGTLAEVIRFRSTGNIAMAGDAAVIAYQPGILALRSYTVGTLPSANAYTRGMIYVADGTGNQRMAISDGAAWRFPSGSVVS